MLCNCVGVSASNTPTWNLGNKTLYSSRFALNGDGEGTYTDTHMFYGEVSTRFTPSGLWFAQSDRVYNFAFYFKAENSLYEVDHVIDIGLSVRYYFVCAGQRWRIFPGWNYFVVSSLQASSFDIVVEYECSGRVYTGSSTPRWGYFRYKFVLNDVTFWVDDLTGKGLTADDRINLSIQAGNQLQQEANSLKQQGNQLQQQANQLQQQANETSKGILGQITAFFGSFFENIINAVKSLFIPEDGYFADFFQRLNDFFSDKLGMLYAPIDLFVEIMTAILNASSSSAGIPFPGIKWDDTWLIEPQTIGLPVDEFPELQEKLYFVTDVIMIGAVLMLVQDKYKEVMGV